MIACKCPIGGMVDIPFLKGPEEIWEFSKKGAVRHESSSLSSDTHIVE